MPTTLANKRTQAVTTKNKICFFAGFFEKKNLFLVLFFSKSQFF